MIKFCDKRTNTQKVAFSIRKENGKFIIKFSENGKEYSYYENNIELFDSNEDLIIYSLKKPCHKCGKMTEVLTYLLFDDSTNENLIFPWDKCRLNSEKTMEAELAHMSYPNIEFYPIKTIGSDEEVDNFMLEQFPTKIQMKYSATQKRKYPMNICQHCGSKQGEFFIYEQINKIIKSMEELKIYRSNK